MPVTPEDRRAKLGCVILWLFPKVMQTILKEYISLRGLRGKFQLKDVRTAFTKKEISLMEQLPCIDDFTVELCYKILRYENVMPEPSCKWGNIPHDTEVEVADDIQRIINTINDEISKKCDDISEEFYDEYLKKIKDITKRIDGHLHHDTCIKLYTTICSSDINHLCILQDLTLMQAINVSQIVDEDGETKECFSRMSFVITDTFPNILRDVIRSSIHANRLYQLCIPHLRNFSPDQQNCLQDLDLSNSYGSLDVSLIYRLLKQFQLISPPTKGWGIFPCKGDNRLGDDVERIRYYRNQMAHKTNISIEKTEFENYFDSFRDIGHRMDLNFFQKTNYEETIILHKTCRIDIHMQNKYINTLKELENIKLIFERTPIKFYWGNSFNRSLVQLRSIIQDEKSKGREKVRVQIIFQTESDIERTIDILNSLRDDINKGLSGIEFIVAKKGSIVLNIDIVLDIFETERRLQSALGLFLERILEHITTSRTKNIDMVLVPVEEYKTLDTKKPSSEPLYLHFDFDADLLETDDKIEEQLRQISEVIIKHSNGSGTNSNITATLLPISPEIIPTTTEAFAQAQTPAINNLPVSITFRQELDISFSKNNYRCIHECIKIGKKIVFTDHSYKKRVIICDVDGANVQLFPLSYAPCYITEVDTNTVAVSCSYNKIILIVNLTTGSITSTIKTSDFCWGISYDGNNLYALVGKLLKVMNMAGNVIHTILLPSVRTCDIAIHKNRLICIDKAAIYCCSLDGKLMWKFQNDKYRNLYHVTIDDDDNIYVTDRDTSTVIVVSEDGRHNREILTQSDGLYRPTGIHFDKNENVMLVCNENNRKAFLFDVI